MDRNHWEWAAGRLACFRSPTFRLKPDYLSSPTEVPEARWLNLPELRALAMHLTDAASWSRLQASTHPKATPHSLTKNLPSKPPVPKISSAHTRQELLLQNDTRLSSAGGFQAPSLITPVDTKTSDIS